MRIEYTLSPDELTRAHDAIYTEHLSLLHSKWSVIAIMLVAFGAIFAMIYVKVAPTSKTLAVILGLLGAVGFYVLVYAVGRYQKSGTKPDAIVLEATTQGLTFVDPTGTQHMSWNAFNRFREVTDFFLLLIADESYWHVIPKRAFAESNDLKDFRGYLAFINTGNSAVTTGVASSKDPAHLAGNTRIVDVEFSYCFRDYLDQVLASRYTRAIMVLATLTVIGTNIQISMEGESDTFTSIWETVVVSPMFLAMILSMISLVFAGRLWFGDPHRHDHQSLQITDHDLTFVRPEGDSSVPWNRFTAFKETRRSFVLWQKTAGNFVPLCYLVPKRALGSAVDVELFRNIIADQVPRQTWFAW